MKRFTMVLGLAVLFLAPVVWADVPKLINFQGILKDGSGNPVADGSYFVTFRIYDLPAAGTILWADTQTVATTDGLFNAVLGTGTSVPDTVFNDSVRYLGITVFPDAEMAPRQRLTTAGYSFRSGEWATIGDNLFRLNGKVGIGTASPGIETKLHISHTDVDNFGILIDAHGNSGSEIGLHSGFLRYSSLAKNTYFNAGWQRFNTGDGAFLQEIEPDGDAVFRTVPSGANPISWNEALMLKSSGNVGIGESNPLAKLHVQRLNLSLPSTAALLNEDIIIEDDDAVLGLYSGTGGTFGSAISLGEIDAGVFADKWTMYRTKNLAGARLSFAYGTDTSYAANPALMSLDGPNGRVGIGTISPSAETKLHIRHFDLDNFGLLIDAHGVSGTEIGLHAGPLAYGSLAKNTYFNAGWQRFNTANGAFLQEIEPDGDVFFRTAPAAANPISWNEPLYLNASGKVGIGTASLYSDANTNLTLPGSIGFKNGTAPMMYIYESGTLNQTKWVIAHSPSFPNFGLAYNDSTDDMYFQGVNVGIRTSTPAQALQVIGNIRVGTSGTNGCIQRFDGVSIVGTCASDLRLKKDIRPLAPLLDKVTRLEPVTFNWRTDEFPDLSLPKVQDEGLIAQEVEKILPELVTEDEKGFKAIEYHRLPLMLLQAVKELKAENDELKNRLLKLEQAQPQAKVE